jgi:inosose dehydratase
MATKIRIANAPCSWGALECEGMAGEPIGYRQMLDELRETGYTGTELGDWGFMPTEPAALRAELQQRELAMVGAFVPVALKHAEAHADGAAEAVKVARLLAAVAGRDGTPPLIVLADANGSDPARTSNAGRVTPELGLSAAEWQTFAHGAEQVARAVRDVTGLATAFHHHCAGYVETPDEIARLLELTDPALLGLVFDTGHFLYGAAGAQEQTIQAALDSFGERIWHMHFKDCHPRIAAQSRAEGWDYFEAVQRGVFCELGQGAADFAAATAWLRARDYRGWIVVEQDVLPGMGAPKESAARNRAYLRTIGL